MAGFDIAELVVDGARMPPSSRHTFKYIERGHWIIAKFTPKTPEPPAVVHNSMSSDYRHHGEVIHKHYHYYQQPPAIAIAPASIPEPEPEGESNQCYTTSATPLKLY